MDPAIKIELKLNLYRFLYRILKSKRLKSKQDKYVKRREALKASKLHPIYVCSNHLNCDVGSQDVIVFKRPKRILLIGRDKEGDSIGNHTKSFLWTVNYSDTEIYLYDEYEKNLYKYTPQKNKQLVWHGNIYDIDGHWYDLMVFCNVIDYGVDNGEKFIYQIPKRRPLISYVYAVFEGTVPPVNWVNIINKYFDGLLVPIEGLRQIFVEHGVMVPAFVLPVALDIQRLLDEHHNSKKAKFRFGWSGTLDPRKNPDKILKAFTLAFGESTDVELYMQSRYKNASDYAVNFLNQVAHAPSNVHFVNDMLSDDEYLQLIKSFDAYVFPSRAEGYSVTPREALALGKIVILSSIHAHKNICDLDSQDGVFWCDAHIPVPAMHTSLNNQVCGHEFDITVDELVIQMKDAYNRRKELQTAEKVRKRKESVRRYSIEALRSQYRTLVLPPAIELSNENKISDEKLYSDNRDLVVKYGYYLKNKRRFITIDPTNDGGFCSAFNKYVSHLAWAEAGEVVIPDWRIRQLKINKLAKVGEKDLFGFCYGKESDGNIFLRFFEKPYPDVQDEIYETDMMYYVANRVLAIDDYNAFKEPNLTYIHPYKLYSDEKYFPVFRKKYYDTVCKYITPKAEIQSIIDGFYRENLEGKFVISAHIRCQSHVLELLESAPTFELYETNIRRILAQKNIKIDSSEWVLFIATDNDDAIDYFKSKFPRNSVWQKNVKRLTSDQEKEYSEQREKNHKDMPGFELQERNAKSDETRNLSFGIDIITDMYLLSKGNVFLFVNSNVSTAVSYLNPNIEMFYCKDYEK